MRTGRTRAIGLILPDLTNPFFPELVQAVANTARTSGLLVCLIDSQGSIEGEADGFARLMQHAVDGVIWCPLGTRTPAQVLRSNHPVVLIDRPRPGYDVVHADYFMGGRLLAEHAVQMGHSRVGLMSGPKNMRSARQRRDGFLTSCPRTLEVVWEVTLGFDGVLTERATAALTRRKGATLIVAANDLIAINAIRWLGERGVQVPEDVSITGFDNIRWSDVVTPRLTTIAQPVGAIGAKAVELVQQRMSGRAAAPQRAVIDVALIERDSVRRLG
jgi:LacI family transcriptional regulator